MTATLPPRGYGALLARSAGATVETVDPIRQTRTDAAAILGEAMRAVAARDCDGEFHLSTVIARAVTVIPREFERRRDGWFAALAEVESVLAARGVPCATDGARRDTFASDPRVTADDVLDLLAAVRAGMQ